MDTLEALGTQLETTDDIRGIVRTMKALSSASIRGYDNAVAGISAYDRTIRLGLQIMLRHGAARGHPGAAPGSNTRTALIVVGSDRGLCGRFNDRIAGFATQTLEADNYAHPYLAVIGLRAAARLEAAGFPSDSLFTLPGSIEGLSSKVQSLAVEIDRWVSEKGVGTVRIAFNRRRGSTLAAPVKQMLLPVPQSYLDELADAPWPSPRLPIYRMDRDALLSWLIRQHLFVMLYRALAESLASEHASRLAAMQGAERNIEDRRDALTAAYRQKRQESITRELLDLVAGFEAVRGQE